MVALPAHALGLRVAGLVWELRVLAFVRDQVGGALSSAAVPHGGLGPPIPPLCRCAKCTTDLILRVWRAFHRCKGVVLQARRVFHRECRHSLSSMAGLSPLCTHRVDRPGAWFGRRSGIKEESSALGRHGGQPRSLPSQARGRTNHRSPMPSFPSQAGRRAVSACSCHAFCKTS
jgi:hypothetical protein